MTGPDEHPLDHEDVEVTIIVTHVPTQRSASVSVTAPADTKPTVTESIHNAGQAAMDQLIAQLES